MCVEFGSVVLYPHEPAFEKIGDDIAGESVRGKGREL